MIIVIIITLIVIKFLLNLDIIFLLLVIPFPLSMILSTCSVLDLNKLVDPTTRCRTAVKMAY